MEKKIMHDQNMLDVKNIYKNFGSLKVLKGVSTTVDKGEVISIIGASGSGKSTLLRCMNLLEEPTFGEVWIEGKLMTPVDPYLHYDVIRASKTYKGLVSGGMEDMEAVMKIKAEDLLIEKHQLTVKNYEQSLTAVSTVLVMYVPKTLLTYQVKKLEPMTKDLLAKLETETDPQGQMDIMTKIGEYNKARTRLNNELGRV
jgi:ABC-type histidine transport system ATPase subunit